MRVRSQRKPPIDRALLKLMSLQARAVLRRTVRGVRTVRGAAFFAIGVLVFALWMGPTLVTMLHARREPADLAKVREYFPAALLVACLASLMGSGDKALAFSPAEVNFLFPGPFSRRQLLGYKLLKAVLGALFMGLFMSVALNRFARLWAAAFAGAFLSLLGVHLFTTCVVLVGQTVTAAAYTRGRRVVVAAVVGAALVGVGPALAGSGTDLGELVHRFATSTPGKLLLAPFQPFGRTFTAQSVFPEMLGWAALAAVVDALLLALTMRLDANFLEAAAGASRRVYERTQRLRGNVAPAAFGAGVGQEADDRPRPAATKRLPGAARFGRLRVAQPPWLGGAGPVAWRQLTTAARKAGGLLFVLALSAGVFATFVVVSRRGKDLSGAVVAAAVWFTVLLMQNLKFDFRADLDHLPWLKSLPLHPLALAAGQLAAPVLLLAACHLAMFAAAAAVLPARRGPLLLIAALALPLDLMLMGVENLLFLLFPSRGAAAPGELAAIGRQVVLFLLKVLIVLFAAGIAVGLGAVAMAATRMPALAASVTFVVLALEGLGLVPLVALAYARFDPSTDTPP